MSRGDGEAERGETPSGGGPPRAGAPGLGALLETALREPLDAARAHLPRVLAGEAGEALHELRISTRRLRAGLLALAEALPRRRLRRARDRMRHLTTVLGVPRELDVLAGGVEKEANRAASAAELEVLAHALTRARADAVAALACSIESLRALDAGAILEDVTALAQDARPPRGGTARLVARALAARVRAAWGDLAGVRATRDVVRLHERRIAMKKLRYALEVLAPGLGGVEAARAEEHARAKACQDILGKHHDKWLLRERLLGLRNHLAGIGLRALGDALAPAIARLDGAIERHRLEFVDETEGVTLDEVERALSG